MTEPCIDPPAGAEDGDDGEQAAAARRRQFMAMLAEGLLDDLAVPDVMASAWR